MPSIASEQAVERALDWLARHQDADGRWDGGTARYEDGTAVQGDDDFTVHCPPGQTCFGECAYWEADTALTGLALLDLPGRGYTHKDGKFATTVGNGLDFLLAQQKPDGDLRGSSKAVGMYCHAMATLALCEAYALSLDDRLRDPAERAVSFLVRSRARDGQAWRYEPSARDGDTSILGWVVMAFKSAREVGLRVPDQAGVSRGMLLWLDRVATGQDRGLARYQPRTQGDGHDDGRGLGLPPVPGRRRPRRLEHRSRCLPDADTSRTRATPISITGTTAPWRCISTAASRGRAGTAGFATASSSCNDRPDTSPEAGTPTTACTEPEEAASTARHSPR